MEPCGPKNEDNFLFVFKYLQSLPCRGGARPDKRATDLTPGARAENPDCGSDGLALRKRRLPRRRLALPFLLSVALQSVVSGWTSADENPANPVIASDQGAAAAADIARRQQAAASRGVDYLLERAASMPAAWRAEMFANFVKIVPTEELAEACRKQFHLAIRTPMAELPEVYEPELLRWPRSFRSTLRELERLKQLDTGWREPTRALAKFLAEHEDLLWKGMQPTQRLVTEYRLARLGIKTQQTAQDVIRALRLRWSAEDHKSLLRDRSFMFGVTHVVLVRSGYFDRTLDPAAYSVEVEILDQAASLYAERLPRDPIFIDIAAEVLTARRLLERAESQASRDLVRVLLALQNPDGSWGEKRFNRDTHATLTVVHALIEYVKPFRKIER